MFFSYSNCPSAIVTIYQPMDIDILTIYQLHVDMGWDLVQPLQFQEESRAPGAPERLAEGVRGTPGVETIDGPYLVLSELSSG